VPVLDEDYLILSTIHSAKRGEARRVLFGSGDDDAAKSQVSELIESFGFIVIDLGGLRA
jgi:predicted dinucleotide-binding enzyme